MISFRFHVVSITAIFLAIAIGIVVGTTYVDGAVVDALRGRIDSVEENLAERREENARLEGELGLANAYIDVSSDFAVSGRLTDTPVLLVATRGVDEGIVERVAVLVRESGGVTPGIVWLEPVWDLEGDEERAAMAEIVDGDADDDPADLRDAAWAAVVEELAAVVEPDPEPVDPTVDPNGEGDPGDTTTTTSTTVPEVAAPAVLEGLAGAGFLTVDSLDDDTADLADLAGSDARVLAITGARAEPGPRAAVPALAAAAVDAGFVTVLADVHVEAPQATPRGEALLEALPEEVREAVAVIDHADRAEGQVAAVLALDAAAEEPVGHLGYGEGADGVLPAWTPP